MITLNLKEFTKLQRIKVEGKRYYLIPDSTVAYPSATTVLSTFNKGSLDNWIKRVGEKEANRQKNFAAGHGGDLHKMAEDFVLNRVPNKTKNPFAKVRFKPIGELLTRHVTEVYAVEPSLYSDKLKVAGSIDLVALFDDKVSVIDYKTSKRTKTLKDVHHYFMQASMYAAMIYERWGIKAESLILIISCDDDIEHPTVLTQPVGPWLKKTMEWIEQCDLKPVDTQQVEYEIEKD